MKLRVEVSSNNVRRWFNCYNGSIHQVDRRLSDVSRGRQCAFMNLSAMLLKRAKLLPCFAMDGRHNRWDTYRRCHVCEIKPLTMTPFPIQKHCRWRIYPIEYIGLRWLLIQPNQINICPLRVRNKMFIHVLFNLLAVVLQYSHSCQVPCILLYFLHNLRHFQKFIEALLDFN